MVLSRSNGAWRLIQIPICQELNGKRGLCWNSFFCQHFSSQEIFSLRNCPSVLNLCLKSGGTGGGGKISQLSIWTSASKLLQPSFLLQLHPTHVYFSTSLLDTIYLPNPAQPAQHLDVEEDFLGSVDMVCINISGGMVPCLFCCYKFKSLDSAAQPISANDKPILDGKWLMKP